MLLDRIDLLHVDDSIVVLEKSRGNFETAIAYEHSMELEREESCGSLSPTSDDECSVFYPSCMSIGLSNF
jgi:hypothetical protein